MTERNEWPIKTRTSNFGVIPYGYSVDPEDNHILNPIPEMVKLISVVLDELSEGAPLRDATDRLVAQTGVPISHTGLNAIWKRLRGKEDTPRARKNKAHVEAHRPKNKEEKKNKILSIKQGAEKRKIINAQKRLNKLQSEASVNAVSAPLPFVELADLPPEVTESEQDIAFQPHPGPQTAFLAATEQEVLYGGAAGGGKSYALLADPLRYVSNPNFVGLLIRRTNDELRELKQKSQILYKAIFGDGAVWREKDNEWRFPSGARLWMTYLERDDDVLRYQGQSFTWIAVDELTQYASSYAWDYLRTRLRSTDPTLPCFMRGTTNPGGPGHGWVKRMFIDPAPAGYAFVAKDADGNDLVYPQGHSKAGEVLFYRRFIPAKLSDNPSLMADGRYEANLLSQDDNKRRQLLEGDWTVAEGAAFPEFRLNLHTCEPFPIPADWRRFRSCDFGYSSFSAVHWFAIDPNYDTLYVYRELYVSKKTAAELAPLILEQERQERVAYGVLDSSCWHQRGQTGPTVAEEMITRGCRWRPADRSPTSRVNGRQRLHHLLRVPEWADRPGLVFFNTCRQIIADLPVIPTDPDGGDDIDDRYKSDHAYDSVRYGVMSRPQSFSPFGGSPGGFRMADSQFGY
jgi:hypothetical protein